eukprot:CAMPEP_0179066070 /NCGR_PEP_ID=MMETSP0796-20121207/28790_1 /TAXON_ID=73915 /ORGANISM="Pyrodinium bahamense, Strain pbaha01" /LENGTH=155 /DNA_ID=CAMNT_0020763069 /DNA_START=49 /DNA_END=516 /DNA_ORIENTATION=+
MAGLAAGRNLTRLGRVRGAVGHTLAPRVPVSASQPAANSDMVQLAQTRGMAVRHVVMFSFKDSVAEEQIVALKSAFDAMPKKISAIQEHESGLDLRLPSGQNHPAGKNRAFMWSCDFTDEEAYEAYATHPDHLAVLATVKELMEPGTRAAIQYKR